MKHLVYTAVLIILSHLSKESAKERQERLWEFRVTGQRKTHAKLHENATKGKFPLIATVNHSWSIISMGLLQFFFFVDK